MSSLPFSRLFSMPAFEGLRVLRRLSEERQGDSFDNLIRLIGSTEPDAASFDLDAAAILHDIVPKDARHADTHFYRSCITAVLLFELPGWAKLMTMGRTRFIGGLRDAEFRDYRSLFRQAGLLEEPPLDEDIEWWDHIQARVRLHKDAERMERARQAEKLTIDYERARLRRLGIDLEPTWMAIEDNGKGYDVLSYEPGGFAPTNKLIEVKSTIASPLRFYLTRNEWKEAEKYGAAYVFHVWDMSQNPPALFERTVAEVAPHVPSDNGTGSWSNAEIRVHLPK